MCQKNTQSVFEAVSGDCPKCQHWRSAALFVDWQGKSICKHCSMCRMSHNIRGHWLGSGDLPDGEKTLEKNYELEKIGHWKSRLDASGLVINEDEMADLKALIAKFENPITSRASTTANRLSAPMDNSTAAIREPVNGAGVFEQNIAVRTLDQIHKIQARPSHQKHDNSSDDSTIEIPGRRKRKQPARYEDSTSSNTATDHDESSQESRARSMPRRATAPTTQSQATRARTSSPLQDFLEPAVPPKDVARVSSSTLTVRMEELTTELKQAAQSLPKEIYAEIEDCVEQAQVTDFGNLTKLIRAEMTAYQAGLAARQAAEDTRKAWAAFKKT